MALQFQCMKCGNWHDDGSAILSRHVHDYYAAGGTFPLSSWKTRLVAA